MCKYFSHFRWFFSLLKRQVTIGWCQVLVLYMKWLLQGKEERLLSKTGQGSNPNAVIYCFFGLREVVTFSLHCGRSSNTYLVWYLRILNEVRFLGHIDANYFFLHFRLPVLNLWDFYLEIVLLLKNLLMTVTFEFI